MNVKLAREIYSGTWLMDAMSFSGLFNTLSLLRSGVNFTAPETKFNSSTFYDLNSVSFVNDKYELKKAPIDAKLINIIHINGVITKNGGVSSYGTKEISQSMLSADKDSRVVGHIIMADSGGGSTAAVQFMTDAIAESSKPVVSFIEKGALAGSAMYGIIAKSDYIISEKENNYVGSIGTYMEFAAPPKQAELSEGIKYVRIYASKSDLKNIEFEEAINNDNFKPAIENILDPVNEEFINSVLESRPNTTEEQLRGKMVNAGDAVGSLVDEIASFDVAVNKVLELSSKSYKKEKKSNKNINTNNNNMTLEQLKSEYPTVYGQVFNAGVLAERDRAGAWLAHVDVDANAVIEGINSGEQISQTASQQLIIKRSTTQRANEISNGSAPAVVTPESQAGVGGEKTPEKEIENSFANIKLK